MDWDTFRKRFIYKGWVDERERPNTMAALKFVADRLPEDTLKGQRVAIWAHGKSTAGYAFSGSNYIFICIYPHIETMSQSRILNTVAHEFAHVILGHPLNPRPTDDRYEEEQEANKLGEKILRGEYR